MGGPIKAGVMHGIREPYAQGTRAALVGNPLYPRTGGREHHVAPILGIAGINAARWLATLGARKVAQKAAQKTFQNVGKTIGSGTMGTGSITGGAGLPMNIAQPLSKASKFKDWAKGWWSGDPSVRGAKWGWEALTSPTAKGIGQKTVKSIFSPTGIALGAGWYLWPDGSKRKTPPPTGVEKPGGYPGAVVKEEAKISQAQRDAYALAERNKRVKKYLDLMGYDRSKKTAIADALIDASKIVGERGTLDPKNITQELINPIIQATSKRLDKPDQIREAVGLMMTKAGLEKEMYDAKPGTVAKNVQDMVKSGKFTEEEAWAIATKGSQGAVADIQGAIATGKVTAASWPSFLRATGKLHDLPVTVVTEEQIKGIPELKDKTDLEIVTERQKGDGLYMIGNSIFQVEGGTPTQIV